MDLYQHVRVVVSILVGFSLTHLLKGAARLVQHPGRERVYWVHLVWTFFIFIFLINFWWSEFRLQTVLVWTFPLYLLVVIYGILLYLLCALLFPDDLKEYEGFEGYFYLRKQWFFGVLAATWAIDYVDTLIKGDAYLQTLGIEYNLRLVGYIICSLVAIWTKNKGFHAGFAVIGTLYELTWVFRRYFTLG
jgi:hypothetical protein